MNDIVFYALLATLGTWLVTALGAATVGLFKSPNPKILNLMLGFAAGVMVAASFWCSRPSSARRRREACLRFWWRHSGFSAVRCSCGVPINA